MKSSKSFIVFCIVLLIAFSLLISCNYTVNTNTPSAPTITASPANIYTPAKTNIPTVTFTSSIEEITATRTIIEVTPHQ